MLIEIWVRISSRFYLSLAKIPWEPATYLTKKIGLGWILRTINLKPSPTSVFKWKNFKSLSENHAAEARFSLHCGFVHDMYDEKNYVLDLSVSPFMSWILFIFLRKTTENYPFYVWAYKFRINLARGLLRSNLCALSDVFEPSSIYRHRHITSKEKSRDVVLVLVEEGYLVERKLAFKAIGETDFD